MSYQYKARHSQNPADPVSPSRRLPLVAASAALVAAAAAGLTIYHSASAVPAPDAQTWATVADPSQLADPAARNRELRQAAPEAATSVPKTGASSAPARRGATTAPPAAAKAPSAQGTPSAQASPAAPAAKTLSYQFQWQENFYFCGPAATRIALTSRGLQPSQSEVAQSLRTTVNGTNSADDATRALNALTGGSFYKSRFIGTQAATQADMDRLRADVVHAISNGYPVVANIAGSTVDNDGIAHSYPGGHFLTVVGYSDAGQNVTIADPADARGVGRYTLTTVKLAHWIALRGYSA
ncbi:C39 family peptidase [Dactylosporangium roseum]|uniref:C39 family peptidase n=1 Tax=Dactylosporangium roseum TaxID=47989 RepID=A0ABY5YX21_9ACTN|nr:C39 family peptidase [Dactylosporangium roseum]UWZ33949.1 C39 family peptidase [Dactylosporangium roseum]